MSFLYQYQLRVFQISLLLVAVLLTFNVILFPWSAASSLRKEFIESIKNISTLLELSTKPFTTIPATEKKYKAKLTSSSSTHQKESTTLSKRKLTSNDVLQMDFNKTVVDIPLDIDTPIHATRKHKSKQKKQNQNDDIEIEREEEEEEEGEKQQQRGNGEEREEEPLPTPPNTPTISRYSTHHYLRALTPSEQELFRLTVEKTKNNFSRMSTLLDETKLEISYGILDSRQYSELTKSIKSLIQHLRWVDKIIDSNRFDRLDPR